MSRTMKRNGLVVERAFRDLVERGMGVRFYGLVWVSVGQVVQATGMSRPTVRRYLDILVQSGCCERFTFMSMYLYTLRRS